MLYRSLQTLVLCLCFLNYPFPRLNSITGRSLSVKILEGRGRANKQTNQTKTPNKKNNKQTNKTHDSILTIVCPGKENTQWCAHKSHVVHV